LIRGNYKGWPAGIRSKGPDHRNAAERLANETSCQPGFAPFDRAVGAVVRAIGSGEAASLVKFSSMGSPARCGLVALMGLPKCAVMCRKCLSLLLILPIPGFIGARLNEIFTMSLPGKFRGFFAGNFYGFLEFAVHGPPVDQEDRSFLPGR
jgi:hypothetical protein